MKDRTLTSDAPPMRADLSAVLIHGDGSTRDLGSLSSGVPTFLAHPIAWWRSLWMRMRGARVISAALCFAAFMSLYGPGSPREYLIMAPMFGLVTTAGVNFLATDMASGQASPRISSMNFHDSGTGTTAAAIGDTALQTQAGPATRATGTQSNPVAGTYKSLGTVAYVSTLVITEWGLFNQAAQGGSLWDRRVFGAINVVSGDSVAFSYSLVVNPGGS